VVWSRGLATAAATELFDMPPEHLGALLRVDGREAAMVF
jgi:hypothetical protein